MQLALINRKKGRNLFEKGFTLVELMIVIVIVGVLSAVALPNFLSQTNKAKGTEARSQISSIIKGASASYLEGGDTKVAADITAGGTNQCLLWGSPDVDITKFNYKCDFTTPPNLKVTATGNTTDTNLSGAVIIHDVNLTTGIVTPNNADTSQMFGGATANPDNTDSQ
jgi:type IV pilus assembly protein PilA